MKKKLIIYILAIVTFYSCAEDSSEYIDNSNPIEGEWNFYSKDSISRLLHTRIYTKNFEAYFSLIDGIPQTNPEKENYRIEGNKLLFGSYTQTFELKEDTLWITNSKEDQITKYIRKPKILIE